jgi:hypothetical protein
MVGHVIWAVGWWMAAQREGFDERIPAVEVAVLGLLVVIFADVSWLLRARFSLMTRRHALLPDATDEPAMAVGGPVSAVVGGPGLDRYHRADCPLADGKGWPVLPPSERDVRRPCQVCVR